MLVLWGRIDGTARENRLECRGRTLQSLSARRDLDTQEFGDLLVTQAIDLMKFKGDRLIIGEALEGVQQLRRTFRSNEERFGARRRLRSIRCFSEVDPNPTSFEQDVSRDGEEPCSRRRFSAKARGTAERAGEDFLEQVLGFDGACATCQEGEDLVTMKVEELRGGTAISLRDSAQ